MGLRRLSPLHAFWEEPLVHLHLWSRGQEGWPIRGIVIQQLDNRLTQFLGNKHA